MTAAAASESRGRQTFWTVSLESSHVSGYVAGPRFRHSSGAPLPKTSAIRGELKWLLCCCEAPQESFAALRETACMKGKRVVITGASRGLGRHSERLRGGGADLPAHADDPAFSPPHRPSAPVAWWPTSRPCRPTKPPSQTSVKSTCSSTMRPRAHHPHRRGG